jgi:mono/diheme cytochrome c family protein
MRFTHADHDAVRPSERGLARLGSRGLTCLILVAVALLSAGCSVKGGDNANLILGKQAFVAKCGSCHTLARAGTKGIVGPNLDEAFRASVAEGLERDSIRGVVEEQIKIPNPEGAMPQRRQASWRSRPAPAANSPIRPTRPPPAPAR